MQLPTVGDQVLRSPLLVLGLNYHITSLPSLRVFRQSSEDSFFQLLLSHFMYSACEVTFTIVVRHFNRFLYYLLTVVLTCRCEKEAEEGDGWGRCRGWRARSGCHAIDESRQKWYSFFVKNFCPHNLSTNILLCGYMWLIDWLIDWLTDWFDWSVGRSGEWVCEWVMDWWIDWLVDWLIDCRFVGRQHASLYGHTHAECGRSLSSDCHASAAEPGVQRNQAAL